jgi:putative exosortase-associated protein (TIGR04073 family)
MLSKSGSTHEKETIMNKKIITCLFLGSLLSAGSAFATEQNYPSQFGSKVSQGLANVTTGFIEIPKNIVNISHEQNFFVGITWGLLRGVWEGVNRTVVGAVELISSPIPTTDFLTPPYVWERFSEDTRYFGLHVPGEWTTYGPLDDGKEE